MVISLFLFSFFHFFKCSGQKVELFNQMERDEPSRNLLYSNVYNRIKVFTNLSCEQITISATNCEIHKEPGCDFYIKPLQPAAEYKLIVSLGAKVIDSQTFYADTGLLLPDIKLSGIRSEGGYRRENILYDSLRCAPLFSDYYNAHITYTVVSFDLEIDRGVILYYREQMNRNRFTQEAVNHIMHSTGAEKILIKDIVVCDSFGNRMIIKEVQIY